MFYECKIIFEYKWLSLNYLGNNALRHKNYTLYLFFETTLNSFVRYFVRNGLEVLFAAACFVSEIGNH